jgi:hypothetical protein
MPLVNVKLVEGVFDPLATADVKAVAAGSPVA